MVLMCAFVSDTEYYFNIFLKLYLRHDEMHDEEKGTRSDYPYDVKFKQDIED